jgi:hypothetical protein
MTKYPGSTASFELVSSFGRFEGNTSGSAVDGIRPKLGDPLLDFNSAHPGVFWRLSPLFHIRSGQPVFMPGWPFASFDHRACVLPTCCVHFLQSFLVWLIPTKNAR